MKTDIDTSLNAPPPSQLVAQPRQRKARPVLASGAACPIAALRERLRQSGLRPTRQRMLLGWLLFMKGDRHLSAEILYQEAQAAKSSLSLATVYNTLNQFSEAGLLRKIATIGEKGIYDTNTGDHHHFFVESDGSVFDVPDQSLVLDAVPQAPPGYRVVGVDVVVRLEREDARTAVDLHAKEDGP